MQFPSPPRPPPSALFSLDPAPHPFTGDQVYLTRVKNVIPQIFPPTAQTHGCFLGEICSPSLPFLLHSPEGLQPQVSRSTMDANAGENLRPCPRQFVFQTQQKDQQMLSRKSQASAVPPPRQLACSLPHSCCHCLRPILELLRDKVIP